MSLPRAVAEPMFSALVHTLPVSRTEAPRELGELPALEMKLPLQLAGGEESPVAARLGGLEAAHVAGAAQGVLVAVHQGVRRIGRRALADELPCLDEGLRMVGAVHLEVRLLERRS